MLIGGLQKMTLIDYPGKIAATVFLIGCNFRCPYCQNPELIDSSTRFARSGQALIKETDFFKFLDQRKGLLDGICITGGEPTIHKDLIDFIKKIKQKGFLIKLDTNGSNPETLKKLLKKKLLDFIAMDIKSSQDNYSKAAGVKVDLEKIKESIEIIRNSGIDHEFRTTMVPELVEKDDIEKIGQWLLGVKNFALQQFQNKKVLDKEFKKIKPYSDKILKDFQKILKKYIKDVELRL